MWQHLLGKKTCFLVGHQCYGNLLAFLAKPIGYGFHQLISALSWLCGQLQYTRKAVITASVAKASYPRATGSNSAPRDPR